MVLKCVSVVSCVLVSKLIVGEADIELSVVGLTGLTLGSNEGDSWLGSVCSSERVTMRL